MNKPLVSILLDSFSKVWSADLESGPATIFGGIMWNRDINAARNMVFLTTDEVSGTCAGRNLFVKKWNLGTVDK
jgi:hypothetical protein